MAKSAKMGRPAARTKKRGSAPASEESQNELIERKLAAAREVENQAIGSSFDEFLAEEGVLTEATLAATKAAVTWQIQQMMELQNISKSAMARELNTSRAVVNRLLDPDDKSLTIKTLGAVADLFGKRLEIRFSDTA